MPDTSFRFQIPQTNLTLLMGDGGGGEYATILWALYARKTIINRAKWWLFCLVFPFKIREWTKT